MATHQIIQFGLLLATSLLFAAAFGLGLARMRRIARTMAAAPAGLPHESSMGGPARAAVIAGTCVGLGLLIWRAADRQSMVLPMADPLDVFLVFGLLLSLTVIYFRWTRRLRALSFFLLPMIVLLLLIGLVLAVIPRAEGQPPDYSNVWTLLHVVTLIAATICFALACVGGVVYLLADRQLRRKGLDRSHRWIGLPALASIEKFNRWLIYGGFPLLSISTVAGILRMALAEARSQQLGTGSGHTKIAMGILSWLIYAVLLHVPLNPRFRGRSAAWLSIAGFILFLATFVAAYWR
jgi:ABC-type uncharacterized transport system permease subunit